VGINNFVRHYVISIGFNRKKEQNARYPDVKNCREIKDYVTNTIKNIGPLSFLFAPSMVAVVYLKNEDCAVSIISHGVLKTTLRFVKIRSAIVKPLNTVFVLPIGNYLIHLGLS